MEFNTVIQSIKFPKYEHGLDTNRRPLLDYQLPNHKNELTYKLLRRHGSINTSISDDTPEDSINVLYTRHLMIDFNEYDNFMLLLRRVPVQSINIVDVGHTEDADYSGDENEGDEPEDISRPNNISNIPLLPIVTRVKLDTSKYAEGHSFIDSTTLFNLTRNIRVLTLNTVEFESNPINIINLDTIQELSLADIYVYAAYILPLAPLSHSRLRKLSISHMSIDLDGLPDTLEELYLEFVKGKLSNLKNLKIKRLTWKYNINYDLIPWKSLTTLEVDYNNYAPATVVARDYPWVTVRNADLPPRWR